MVEVKPQDEYATIESRKAMAARISAKLALLPLVIPPAINRACSEEAWKDYIAEVTSPDFVRSAEGPIGMARGLSSCFMHRKCTV